MIFEAVDTKLRNLGFVIGEENDTGFQLLRAYGKFGGVQKVIFENGQVSSFDSTIPDYKGQGYKAIGLTEEELYLILKKIKLWRKRHEHNN